MFKLTKNNKAFTLIELLVVIAVLGILVLIATPKLFNYTQKAELAIIQSDVKVMETKVSEKLIPGDELLADWDDVASHELTTLAEGGNLYEVKGKVNPENLNVDNFKVVPNELKNEINTKLKGDFYANNNGKVYYKHIRDLNVDTPSDENESSKNGVYTQEEINNLLNNGYTEVKTVEDLNNVRNDLAVKYIQTANIDMSSFENFEPIGNDSTRFTGTYDGGGFEISNLTINKSTVDYIGLFGYTSSATIENVGLKDVDITGRNYVGGLVGYNDGGKVENSYATGAVTGSNYVGGLVGMNNSSRIENSYATGAVSGSGNVVGGLVGYNNSRSTVSNSYATGTVTGSSHVGGLVGWNWNSTVSNSYATGKVTGGSQVGGLVGFNDRGSTVRDSYATGEVTGTGIGNNNVGGLVGLNDTSTVSNSYATGAVTGTGQYVGGLIGRNADSTVSNSYYDTVTTGRNDSGKGIGKSTEDMKEKVTYEGWKFDDVWQIEAGSSYPTLR